MLQCVSVLLVSGVVCVRALAAPSPTPGASPTASATPPVETVIDAMPAADLQQAVQLLKSNYINPEAVNETELARATLLGLLERIGPGVTLFAQGAPQPNESTNPFYADLIEGHIGYLRLGALTQGNLQALDAALQHMRTKKVDAAVIDLRASPATNDFAIAAEFAKRLVAKGKPLFTLRRASSKQERIFTNDHDPAYDHLMLVLADSETSGPAEVLAGLLRLHNKALVIGQPTSGQAVEFSDLPLNGGRTLRVAVAEAVLPDGRSVFPGGVKPDLAVEMPVSDKQSVFQHSVEKGMGPFIFESERPHLNEAALLSGRNPEIEAAEAAQRRRNAPPDKPATRDPVLQRAVDVITSLAFFQQR